MSWQQAKTTAERIYAELLEKHDHGFAGMVIDALRREHARNRPKRPANAPSPDEPERKTN